MRHEYVHSSHTEVKTISETYIYNTFNLKFVSVFIQAANGDYFSQYVTEDFDTYVDRKRHEYVHGNHIEMQAMSEMYNRTVEVFCYGTGE